MSLQWSECLPPELRGLLQSQQETGSSFLSSMVSHQVSGAAPPDEVDPALTASLVAHILCYFLTEQQSRYLDTVESYLTTEPEYWMGPECNNFLTSFLTHCLPLVDRESPDTVELLLSLASRTCSEESELFTPAEQSSASPPSLESVPHTSQSPTLAGSASPGPICSGKHLLSDFSEYQLDRHFSASPASLSASEILPENDDEAAASLCTASPTSLLEEEADIADPELVHTAVNTIEIAAERIVESSELLGRPLSVVSEECEEDPSSSSGGSSCEVEAVVTATCTLALHRPFTVQTVVENRKVADVANRRKVTFSSASPEIIERKTKFSDSQPTQNPPSEPKKNKRCWSFNFTIGKQKKSLVQIVLNWFGK